VRAACASPRSAFLVSALKPSKMTLVFGQRFLKLARAMISTKKGW
jgi:hypothetical protein